MASHDIDSPLTGTVAPDSAAPTLVPTPDGFLRRGEPHVIISGAILAGVVGYYLVKSLAQTGALDRFGAGRERFNSAA